MVISPEETLYSLGIKLTSVDLPQPDIPTMATNLPDSISRSILFNVNESDPSYLKFTLLKIILWFISILSIKPLSCSDC